MEQAEKQPDDAEYLARQKAAKERQGREASEGVHSNNQTPGSEPIAREARTPLPPISVSVPASIPIQPIQREMPPPARVLPSLHEQGQQESSANPQPVSHTTRPGHTRIFKVGFWILGVSQAIIILESFVPAFSYFSHYGMAYTLGFLIQMVVGIAFVVINCRFLARRRYGRLLWLSLVFAALGTVANNLFWLALEWHVTYAELGILGMFRGFFISSGLPLSCLCSPFIRYFGGRMFYWSVVVNIDCALKIGFLIWAIAKYHDDAPPSQPSA
jgi:hypothetical protein